jgi:ATP-binding cassette subfamily B protein
MRLLPRFSLFGDGDFKIFVSIFRTYFPEHKKRYLLIFFLIGISAAATAAAAWLVRDVVNGLFVEKRADVLLPLFLVIVAAFVAKGLSTYWQSLLSARIANDIVARTQQRVFTHIFQQKIGFFDRYSSDDLTMRVNQGAGAFGAILNQVILNGARDFATVASLVAVMVTQDATLTFICLVAVPPAFVLITMLLKRIKDLMRQEMRSVAELNKHVRETVQGVKVIKAYNLEPIIKQEAYGVIESIRDRSNRVSALQGAPVPIIDSLGGIAVGLVILYAGYRSVYGNYDPGTFLSFITSMLLAMDPARRLSQLRVQLKTSLVGVGLVDEVLNDNDPEASASSGGTKPIPARLGITLSDVSFAYAADTPVLSGFSLAIEPGELVALIGPSGAGKSTVFSLLLRFYQHQAGSIRIGNEEIDTIPTDRLRDLVSYVGQSNFMFSGSIRDNLTLRRPGISDETVIAASKSVGLHAFVSALPQGYDTQVGELGSMISGGQAQRLNIARAIIKDAPILLFDEVTSSLDADNEELIRTYMHAQAGKKTILVIAHRLSTIRQADRIALIEGGRVKAFGTHQDLVRKDPYYERVAALQLIA